MTEDKKEPEVVLKPNPLPLTYYTIFKALEDLFPEQVFLILHSIKKIIVVKKDVAGFSTMGIDRNGNLYISQTFWDTHMKDYNALKTVLFHELLHCIGGDVFHIKTKKDGKDWQLKNQADLIAMDSRINAFICNLRPDIRPEEFLWKFYNDEEYKDQGSFYKVLRPYSEMLNQDELKMAPEYEKFYSTDDFSNHTELSKVIFDLLKQRQQQQGKKIIIKLLGMHGDSGEEITEEDLENADIVEVDISDLSKEKMDEIKKKIEENRNKGNQPIKDGSEELSTDDIKDAIGEVIKDYLQSEYSQAGAGKGTDLVSLLLDRRLDITEKFDLQKFKQLMFNNIFHNVRSQAKVKIGSYSTIPYIPSRLFNSDIVKLAMGWTPTLFKCKKYAYKMDYELLPIYLDVSGSTNPYLPEIIRLVANVSRDLEFVWGFSNKVVKHTIKDLEEGKIVTTGGTDFDCVLDHVEKHGFKHIVVITDGDAGTRRTEKLPGLVTAVTVLFGYNVKNNYFSNIYGSTHDISEVKI